MRIGDPCGRRKQRVGPTRSDHPCIDPELPFLTIAELGILRGVTVAEDGAVEVAITPTYTGCVATRAIADDVREVRT